MAKPARSQPLAKLKAFKGELSLDRNRLPVSFRAGVDASGAIDLRFTAIPLTKRSIFILHGWEREKSLVTYFSLKGTAEDGTTFDTSHLSFNSLGTTLGPLKLQGRCSKAVITYKLACPVEKPALRVRLKGFKSFSTNHAECALGTVQIAALHEFEDANIVTGSISIQTETHPADVEAWRKEAEKLVEHIRRVMSFASASMLRAPLFEFFNGDTIVVTAYSETRAWSSPIPVIHFLDHETIFQTAVRSFFNPPVAVKHLFFAIEWLAMHATYSEVRLVAAMTALENLIDSNLDEVDASILPKKGFEKTRRVLRKVIRRCVEKWPDGGDEVTRELNERLADLNRRAFLRKLKLLATHWGVPLDDISEASLQAAKNSRDRIVHRGQYYEDRTDDDPDLWEHVTIIREVAIRFVLTALGFKGRYESYVGGHHSAMFPPSSLGAP